MNAGVIMGVYQIARITNPDVDLAPYLEGHMRVARTPNQAEPNPWQIIFYGLMMFLVFSMRSGFLPFLAMGSMGGHRGRGSMGGGGFGGFSGGGGGFSGGGASGGW